MKIIVAHPSKQHSFQTATALKQGGMLFKYVTSVYDKKGTITYLLKNFLNKKNRKKASTRKTNGLDDDDVMVKMELSALFLLLLRRIPYFRRFYNDVFVWRRKRFGRYIAKYAMENSVDAVIMYDSTAMECFSILKAKAPKIKRILDVSMPNRAFMRHNFEKDMEETHECSLKNEQSLLWNDEMMKDYLQEVLISGTCLVPSTVVKESLIYVGFQTDNIYTVPYGVDISKFNFIQKSKLSRPLRLIYVGQILYLKGIHHLLKVVSKFKENEVQLNMAGAYNPNQDIYQKYKGFNNIHFLGFITRDILATLYQKNDVFVFPSLGDGYGMVVLEALSCGVPCIVSDLSGGKDAIVDSYNGFVFKAGDDMALKDRIQWFIDNPDKLPEMSQNARLSVKNLTWNDYYKHIQGAMREIINNK